MPQLIVYSFLGYFSLGCQQSDRIVNTDDSSLIITEKDTHNITKVGDIILPPGFIRVSYKNDQFGAFLRSQELDPDNTVHLYNGELKSNQNVAYKVLNIDVGKKDLQQCADAAIRLRAEYLFDQKKFDQICFKFTNGQNACWNEYAKGMRASLNGNRSNWIQKSNPDSSYNNFRKYLDLIFTYCGTQSLQRDLKSPGNHKKIEAGDIFIQSRNPYGHAVIVIDVAEDKEGNRIFLLAQSYMPAQQIHILKNFNTSALSPCYSLKDTDLLSTPEWKFSAKDRKTF